MRRWVTGLFLPALALSGLLPAGAGCKRRGGVLPGMARTKERTESGEGGELISQLGRPDTRAQAARKLGERKIAKAVPALRGYLKDGDPEVRLHCVWALGEIGERKAVPDVRTLLTDKDHRVRAAAAEALGKMPDVAAVLWLGEALRDQVAGVRLAAAGALGNIRDEEAAGRLVTALHDAKGEVAAAAAEGLGKIGKPAIRHVQADLPKLRDEVRLLVTRELAGLNDLAAAPALIEALSLSLPGQAGKGREEVKAKTRQVAIDALAALGEPAAAPLIDAAVRTPGNVPFKREAAKVLKRLGKVAVRPVVERISAWQTFPDTEELKVWVEVLEAVGSGDPAAQAVLVKARAQLSGKLAPSWSAAARTAPDANSPKPPEPLVLPDVKLPEPVSSGGFNGELRVVLHKALFRGREPTSRRAHLILNLEAADGIWGRLWGMALGYNNGMHSGQVLAGAVTDDAARLKVNVLTGEDLWVHGGDVAAVEVDLKRRAARRFEGTYAGTFKGKKVSGRAVAEIKPPRPVRAGGFQPVRPGEHPRVLLRKGDLPALRRKLATPFGRTYFDKAVKSWDLVSLGMLHQLTGDRQYAKEAGKIIEAYKGEITANGFGSGGFGHRLFSVCMAYDLCFDAWPAAFREEIEAGLIRFIRTQQKYLMTGHPNFHPCSNYYGPGRAVPAIASLTLLGRKGPAPTRPPIAAEQAGRLKPASHYEPGEGAPVVDFAPGRTPTRWLYGAPVPANENRDLLEALGGYGQARPEVGKRVKYVALAGGLPKEASMTFQPVPPAAVGPDGVDLAKLAPGAKTATAILYTVLKVAEARTVGFVRRQAGTKVWLAGRELNDRDYYRLTPGLYPMLAVLETDRPQGALAPRLSSPDSDDLAERRAKEDLESARWKADLRDWQALGGADTGILRFVNVGRQQVYWHYRLGIGDGGFQAETGGYANISSWYPLVYATAHLRVFGRNASPYPDVTHLMPRKMMQVLFRESGEMSVLKLNSAAGIDARWCAAAFPIVPDRYKPAMLWAWRRTCGMAEGDPPEKALAARGVADSGLTLAHTFLHYPLDMKPAHPSRAMPLTWQSPTFGFHCFRSGWSSDDDFIAQVFLKASRVGGWNHPNAGAFRVYGLGRAWAVGPTSRNGARPQESVVLLGEDQTYEGACGRLAHLKTYEDGSGSLTIDMNDVYSRPAAKGRGLYDGNLIRWPENFAASGITGLRAVAFDYSGRSGAPCLMVLVDRIEGGGGRLWTWQVPADDLGKVRIGGSTFTLDHGDASMKATFVAPQRVSLSAGTDAVQVGTARHGFHGDVHRVKTPGAGSFFVVATFQRGRAPEVKVSGSGLNARVTVGGRTIRFDGERILLGG